MVQTSLGDQGDRMLFFSATSGSHDYIEITFSDADVLPLPVVERLYALMEKYGPNLSIITFRRVLWSYLSKLNIKNTYTAPPQGYTKGVRALAIGGSAGSTEKIIGIVKHLPLMDITVFIVQHIREDIPTAMDQILKNYTSYTVKLAKSGTQIETKTIYIAPPGLHTIAIGGYIYLTADEKVNFSRPSIDVMFRSLSESYEEELVAVLLCGYGRDGSGSLEGMIKKASTIIIEDPDDCEAKDMPINALATKHYTFKLSLNEIIDYLKAAAASGSSASDEEVSGFLEAIYTKYGYDFRGYNLESIKRRIQTSMAKEQMASFYEFREKAIESADMFKRLFFEFSINVTTFFRNPQTFKFLREKIFPYLQSYHHIKIWCAGSATGEEPYSLGIILHELGMLDRCQIFATDFNPIVIEQAKNGLFSIENLKINEKNYNESGGTKTLRAYMDFYGSFMKIRDEIQKKILFFTHNLATDGVFNEFQLILCRNVLIYFDVGLQERVLRLFSDSLDMSGFVVLGESEGISINKGEKYFTVYGKDYKIYRKNTTLQISSQNAIIAI
ncbi:MAG: hypothetical protein HQL01_00125 [Nitrospirae bacterium]|nr:hypothetical protein [Nitrospirota bacterium]